MRVNIYAEELHWPDDPEELVVERVKKVADTGRTFFGVRLYLRSANELHNVPGDDDRSAITIWGPRARVARTLRLMADEMEK